MTGGPGDDPALFDWPVAPDGAARRRLDIAKLLQVEQAATAIVEPVGRLWRQLASSADATVSATSLDSVLRSSLATMSRLLGVNTVAILLANEAGDELVARAAIGLSEELSLHLGIRAGRGMSGRVLASLRPLVIGDLSGVEVVNPILRDSGLRSVAAVPLQVGEQRLGVMYAASYELDRFTDADADLLQVVADRLAAALDRVRLFERERAARQDAERLADRLGRMQRATATLSAARTPDEVAAGVADLFCDAGTSCTVWLVTDERVEPVVPGVHGDAGAADPARQETVAAAVRTCRAAFADGDAAHAVVPFVHGGVALGAIEVAGGRPEWTGDDRDLLTTAAGQAAQALARIRLTEAERAAAARSGFFARAAQVLAEADTLLDTLERLGDLAVQVLGEICLIDVVGEDGELARMVATHRDREARPLTDRLRVDFPPDPAGGHPAVAAIRSGRSSWSATMTEEFLRATTVNEDHLALTQALGFRSYVTVPLVAGERVLGSVTSVSASRSFGAEDIAFAEQLARQVAAVVDNARRYDAAYRTSQILQSSLLPATLPAVPGLDVETRYLTAARALEVGGDFYDTLVLPSGRVLCVIGDVAGHDRWAAAQMGHLRSAVRTLAGQVPSPGELVASLRWSWDLIGLDRLATVLLAVVSVETGDLEVASAGHYPPLVVGDGGARFLEVPATPPLGAPAPAAGRGAGAAQWEGRLAPDELLLCYTDGAIDERGVGPQESMERLAAVAAAGPRTPRLVCDRVVAVLDPGRPDDAALLAVVRSPTAPPGPAARPGPTAPPTPRLRATTAG